MEFKYPVCNLWLLLVKKYNKLQPFSRFSKDYSLDYNKVKNYGNNTFTSWDQRFIEKVCGILDCTVNDLFVDDEEEYLKHRKSEELPSYYGKGEGAVYFIRNNQGFTKIGRTKNLKERLKTLRSDPMGKGLKLVHYIESKDINVLEKTLHQVFASKRIRGEWFDLSDEDIELFKQKKAYKEA